MKEKSLKVVNHEYQPLISTNHNNENFEFYIDEERTVLIENPEDYENTQSPFNQSIFVKIITDQDCYRESRIDLKIGASLIDENFMEKYSTCETSESINSLSTIFLSSLTFPFQSNVVIFLIPVSSIKRCLPSYWSVSCWIK